MYDPTPIDRNIKKQAWFKRMLPEHRLLLKDLFYQFDAIGIWEIDLDDFYSENEGIVKKGTIDMELFVNDCNNDGRERVMLVDRETKLWFNSTIFFKGANNQGFRTFSANQRDASIIRQLSQRSITRNWFVEQVVYNDKLSISGKLLNMVFNNPNNTETVRDFSRRIAKAINHTILESREQPESIKSDFGNQCQYCGESFKDYELEIDHIVPTSQGGPDRYWNKVPACKKCNSTKGANNVFVFLQNSGLELTEGLKSRVEKLVKKRILSAPPSAPIKRKSKKEKFFTYDQIQKIHFNDRDTRKMEDFEITTETKNGNKLWIQKA